MDNNSLSKLLDLNSNYLGISPLLLMENAGKEIANIINSKEEDFPSVAIFCGCGNNGGDGFVSARHLASSERRVKVYYISSKNKKRTKISQENLDILKNLPTIELFEILDSSDSKKILDEIKNFDLIIDALLGVGVKGELMEPYKSIVEIINKAKKHVISVDSPTPGLNISEVISFHFKKTEDSMVVSIGIPREAELFSGPGDVFYALPKRIGGEHKGDFGRLLILGGSRDYIGAPSLVSKAAYLTGVDLAFIFCPKYVAMRIPYDPNQIIKPLDSENHLMISDLERLRKVNFDTVVLGNGIGKEDETKHFVRRFLREIDNNEKRIILDADALKLIEPGHLRKSMVITPHNSEFEKLFGKNITSLNDSEKIKVVQDIAKKFNNTTIVLKGRTDIISNGIETKLNKTGNAGMTVGGTGDVLAGVIGALLTNKKIEPIYSASAGTFLTGLAGDISEKELGYTFSATDVIKRIPKGIKYCESYFWMS